MEAVYPVSGNYVIDLEAFLPILQEVAVCRSCQTGNLELWNHGTKASCASYLMFKCASCSVSKSFWSVSGKFLNKTIPIGDLSIPKRNAIVYSTVFGGSLIGIWA